jgi:uncharacterized protein YodC (DUF2158 family)
MHNQEVPLKTSGSSTITISDVNAGTYVCINTTGPADLTYVISENIILTN